MFRKNCLEHLRLQQDMAEMRRIAVTTEASAPAGEALAKFIPKRTSEGECSV